MSYKRLFSRALSAAPGRLHFAAHSHHLWPDASYEGHLAAWDDAARLADLKWDKVFGEIAPQAQRHIADELRLPDSSTIAFAPNTHELLIRVLSAHKGRPLRILSSDGEFHSFRRQSARLVESGRAKLDIVRTEPAGDFAPRFLAVARAGRHDLIYLSHVLFKTGYVFPALAELSALAKPDGPWLMVDTYHSFMALPADFSAMAERTFVLSGGYKYAMSGEGAGFMHAPADCAERPELTGWFAEFGALEHTAGQVGYAPGGARFWGATFDPTPLYRFNAVRTMLAREGLTTESICAHVSPLLAALAAMIANGEAGALVEADLINPPHAGRHGARFLALKHDKAPAWKGALVQRGVITDARDDILRIGLGLYHDAEDLPAFCAAAKTLS
jgi:selenocysteine lyase/cysteine desulfurase